MAKKKRAPTQVGSIRHKDKRKNMATAELRRLPCFRGLLWIRCVAETKRGREGRLARLPGLPAVDG
jgi:hypothetical protein